jgi:hypothetical protein
MASSHVDLSPQEGFREALEYALAQYELLIPPPGDWLRQVPRRALGMWDQHHALDDRDV